MASFRLQYTSNLLVDLHKKAFDHMVKPICSNLSLLGNIGRPEHPKTYHFLNYCSRNWDRVFWVVGPHELTNRQGGRMTHTEKLHNARSLTKQFNNVSLLDSQEAVFHESRVVLLGTPLWTKLSLPPKGQPEFASIFTSVDEAGPIPLTPQVRNTWHKTEQTFLQERSLFWQIVHPNVHVVYLTHTIPSPLLLRFPLSSNQSNRLPLDMLTMEEKVPPHAWIGGSTGSTHTVNIGTDPASQTHCGVNSFLEYGGDFKPKESYDPTAVLEIHPDPPSKDFPLTLPRLTLPSLIKVKMSLAYS